MHPQYWFHLPVLVQGKETRSDRRRARRRMLEQVLARQLGVTVPSTPSYDARDRGPAHNISQMLHATGAGSSVPSSLLPRSVSLPQLARSRRPAGAAESHAEQAQRRHAARRAMRGGV